MNDALTFSLPEAAALLARTPAILADWLEGVPASWIAVRERPETWSAEEILGHLIHGERTDWIPRACHILAGDGTPFTPFDREAMLRRPSLPVGELLQEFAAARRESLATLDAMQLGDADLGRTGTHPELGRVTLRQLLASWVVHDLSHIGQIARVMAKAYRAEVGPWRAYLPIVDR